MITKRKSSQPGFVCVCFELPAYLWADRVCVVGDFNDWDHRQTPMQQDRHGGWRVEVDLPYGQRFQFRYLVDDHWLTDSHADGMTDNPFGTQNSIVATDLSMPVCEAAPVEVRPAILFAQKQAHLTYTD